MKRLFSVLTLASLSVLLLSFAGKEIKIGASAPDFSLKNVDGSMVSLDDFNDKEGVILIFTCNHCPYAKMYEDRIKELHATYADKGWPVVAINPNDPAVVADDSYANMQVRAKEKGFEFPYLFDENQKIYPKYGATRTPHAFLLKNTKKGFKVAYVGAIDDNAKDPTDVKQKFVEDAISAIKAGKKVDPANTKAIGCSIKKQS